MAKPMGRFTVPQGPRFNPRIFQAEAARTSFGTRRRLLSLIVIVILSPGLREVEFTDRSRRIPNPELESDAVLFARTSFGKRRKSFSPVVMAIFSPGLRDIELAERSRRIPEAGLESDAVL